MFLNIFFVDENLRGHGIGKAIMKHLSGIAVERDYERIEWLCLDWNKPSLDFYRGIGSREISSVITFRLLQEDMERLSAETKALSTRLLELAQEDAQLAQGSFQLGVGESGLGRRGKEQPLPLGSGKQLIIVAAQTRGKQARLGTITLRKLHG